MSVYWSMAQNCYTFPKLCSKFIKDSVQHGRYHGAKSYLWSICYRIFELHQFCAINSYTNVSITSILIYSFYIIPLSRELSVQWSLIQLNIHEWKLVRHWESARLKWHSSISWVIPTSPNKEHVGEDRCILLMRPCTCKYIPSSLFCYAKKKYLYGDTSSRYIFKMIKHENCIY